MEGRSRPNKYSLEARRIRNVLFAYGLKMTQNDEYGGYDILGCPVGIMGVPFDDKISVKVFDPRYRIAEDGTIFCNNYEIGSFTKEDADYLFSEIYEYSLNPPHSIIPIP